MRFFGQVVISASIAAFGTGYVLAQEVQPRSAPQVQPAQAPERAQPRTKQQAQRMSPDRLNITDLRGKDVYDREGRKLGEIDDLVVDMQNGRVHAAVMQSGGVFGIGGNNYAFKLTEFKLDHNDRVLLDVDKQRLENAEGFAKGQWPEMGNKYWGRTAQSGGTSGQSASAESGASAGGSSITGGEGGQARKSAGGKPSNLIRASDVIGKDVHDRAGVDVGEVRDIMVSVNDSRIRGVRLDVDKAGEAIVDPKLLTVGLDNKLILRMDAQDLRSRAAQNRPTGQSTPPRP